jgi:hypothetical protein
LHLHRRARQCCKKSTGIKLLIDSAYEDKILPITKTNCVIKAVEDKKGRNDENGWQYRSLAAVHIKKARAKSLTIFLGGKVQIAIPGLVL